MSVGHFLLSFFLASHCAQGFSTEISDSVAPTYTAFREPGMAMEPTIAVGDVVVVDPGYFNDNLPRPGEVVLYKSKSIPNGPTVKRIVAIGPGKVQLRGGRLIVNDFVIDEPYLKIGGARTPYSQNWGPIDIPPGCIILLGDHRDHSQDSRVDGCSSISDLLGLVKYVAPSAVRDMVREIN